MIDPVTTGVIGWVCGKLADNVLKHLAANKVLSQEVDKALAKWAKTLRADRYVEPKALFADVDAARAEDERPQYGALQDKLIKKELPTREMWHAAFMEAWKWVRDHVEDPQPFFLLEESEADTELERLAELMHASCVQYEPIFKAAVIDKLDSIGTKIDKLAPDDIQAVFEDAANLINNGEAKAAQVVLEGLWKRRNDKMTPRQKSNYKRLIGCSLDRQDKPKEAGRYFLEAKDCDPSWEKARAFESIGQLVLGNPAKAHQLANAVLEDFSQNNVAWAVWIQTAPKNLSFADVEAKVPKHLRDDTEVAVALAVRAASEDSLDVAEEYMTRAKKEVPGNPRVTERLGDLMLQRAAIGEQVAQQRGPSKTAREFLLRAVKFYSESLVKWQEEQGTKGIVRIKQKRAWAYTALLEQESATADITSAYEMSPEDPEVTYTYAATIGKERVDHAIAALKKVAGRGEMPGVEHLLAQMLRQRNQGNDLVEATNLLKGRLKDIRDIPEESRVDYVALLLEIERGLSGIGPALDTLKGVSDEVICGRSRAILQAHVLMFEHKDAAIKLLKEIFADIDENTPIEEQRRLANLMMNVGLHREALSLWKGVVRTDCIGPDTYKMVECAKRSGAEKDILELSSKLRHSDLWDRNIFEYEIYLRQRNNDWRACKQILQNYIEKPLDEEYLSYARAHLSHVAAVLGEIDLIETDLHWLPSPSDVEPGMGLLVVQALRIAGEPVKAVEFAYELVRKNWNSLEAHLTMANFTLPIGPKPLELPRPTVAGPGAAVQYEESRAGVKTWHIIEDSASGVPDASRNEYSVDHPYSGKMNGLKKGDTFLLRGDEIQERKATILELISKYEYRIGDCLEGMEDRFQDRAPVFKINPFREDGQIDIDPLKRLAENRHRQGEELLKLYRNQPLPVYFLASKMGQDLLTTLVHLIGQDGVEIQCRLGHAVEAEMALQALEDVKEIVIDEMALATLLTCGFFQDLAKVPKRLVVSEGTLLNVENWQIMRVDPGNPGGSFGMVDGHLTFASASREEIEGAQNKIKDLIRLIREVCSVESGVALSNFDGPNKKEIVEYVGQACAESMALACTGQRAFWTDDFVSSALLINAFKGRRVWTQRVFEHLSKQGRIDEAIVHQLTLKLVSFGYWFTSLNAETAIEAIAESDWDIDRSPLKEVLAQFGDARVTLDANLMLMIGKLLRYCWTEDRLGLKASTVTVRILNELAKRGNAPRLVNTLWIWLQRVFGLDVLALQQIKGVFGDWLEGRGGGIIVP